VVDKSAEKHTPLFVQKNVINFMDQGASQQPYHVVCNNHDFWRVDSGFHGTHIHKEPNCHNHQQNW